MNHYIALSTPKMLLGRANSLISAISGAGYAIGPVIMGMMLKAINYRTAWVVVSGITAIAAVIMYGLNKIDIRKNNLQAEKVVFKKES
jgi:MFS family permease